MSISQKIFVLLSMAILMIAAVAYFVFDIPFWLALLAAIGGVFVNGLLTIFGKD